VFFHFVLKKQQQSCTQYFLKVCKVSLWLERTLVSDCYCLNQGSATFTIKSHFGPSHKIKFIWSRKTYFTLKMKMTQCITFIYRNYVQRDWNSFKSLFLVYIIFCFILFYNNIFISNFTHCKITSLLHFWNYKTKKRKLLKNILLLF